MSLHAWMEYNAGQKLNFEPELIEYRPLEKRDQEGIAVTELTLPEPVLWYDGLHGRSMRG